MYIAKRRNGTVGLAVNVGGGVVHFRGMTSEIDIPEEDIESKLDSDFFSIYIDHRDNISDYIKAEIILNEYAKECDFIWNGDKVTTKITRVLSWLKTAKSLCLQLDKENTLLKAEKERLLKKTQKYGPNNIVWALWENAVNCYAVKEVKTVEDINNYYCIKYGALAADVFVFTERMLFPTKEELLKSL